MHHDSFSDPSRSEVPWISMALHRKSGGLAYNEISQSSPLRPRRPTDSTKTSHSENMEGAYEVKITLAIHGRTLRGAELLQIWNRTVNPTLGVGKSDHILAYCTSGEGRLVTNSAKYRFFANSGFIIQSNHKPEIEGSPNSPHFDIYIIRIKDVETDLLHLLDQNRQSPNPIFRIGTERRMLFEEITQKFTSPRHHLQKSASLLLESFLYEISDPSHENANPPVNRHVEKALERMHASIHQDTSMEELCQDLEISQSHLSRLFQETFGVSPKAYFSKLKMDAARALLAQTDLPIQEISERMGYLNPFSFSRAFSQITGQSPSAYRSQTQAMSVGHDAESIQSV